MLYALAPDEELELTSVDFCCAVAGDSEGVEGRVVGGRMYASALPRGLPESAPMTKMTITVRRSRTMITQVSAVSFR